MTDSNNPKPPRSGPSSRQSAPHGECDPREGRGAHSASQGRTAASGVCGASILGYADRPVGPCVLRNGHDGPVHQAADGAQWWTIPHVGYCPHCGRGDVAPTGERLAEAQRDAARLWGVIADVHRLRQQWLAAGLPIGTSVARWWDRRLSELGEAGNAAALGAAETAIPAPEATPKADGAGEGA